MSGSALIRAAVCVVIGLVFLYAGIFNPLMMFDGATSQPGIGVERSRLVDLGLGVAFGLFGSWIIRRQLRGAPPFVGFGTSGKLLLGFAGVVGLAAVGYGFWDNAHHPAGPPARRWLPLRPANNGPASAPEPLPPTGE